MRRSAHEIADRGHHPRVVLRVQRELDLPFVRRGAGALGRVTRDRREIDRLRPQRVFLDLGQVEQVVDGCQQPCGIAANPAERLPLAGAAARHGQGHNAEHGVQRGADFLTEVGQHVGLHAFGRFGAPGLGGQPLLRVAGVVHEQGGGADRQDRQDPVADYVRQIIAKPGQKSADHDHQADHAAEDPQAGAFLVEHGSGHQRRIDDAVGQRVGAEQIDDEGSGADGVDDRQKPARGMLRNQSEPTRRHTVTSFATSRRERRIRPIGLILQNPTNQDTRAVKKILGAHGLVGIVAAVLITNKDHAHWDAGRGEGGGIVGGRAAEAQDGDRLGLRGGLQPRHDRGVDVTHGGAGLGPKVETDAAALLDAADDAADGFVQFRQHRLVIGADVEAEVEGAGNNGETVRGGIGVEAAQGAGHRDAALVVASPKRIKRHGELGPGGRGVAAKPPGQADMIVPAFDPRVGVAEIARDAGADRDRAPGLDQAWRLFDVQFEIGADARRIEMAGAGAQGIGVAAALGDMVSQGAAGIDAADVQGTVGQRAQAAAAADVGDLEPDAFLGADAHHDDVALGLQIQRAQRRHGDQSGEDAGGTVEVAAMRHGIEMRADDQGRRRAVAARQGHVKVGGGVMTDVKTKCHGSLRDGGVGALLTGSIRIARDARFIEAIAAQLIEQVLNQRALGSNGLADRLRFENRHGDRSEGLASGYYWLSRQQRLDGWLATRKGITAMSGSDASSAGIIGSSSDDNIGEMLRETADRLFQAHCDTATQRSADQGEWPATLWAAVEEAGLTRALVPEAAGGFGVAMADALSLLRVAGSHAVPVPLAETMLASWLLAGAGLTIPNGPLTVGPVREGERVTLTPMNGGWRVAGTITRIPWARNVDRLVVLADGHVALVDRAAWSIEPGENIAREPRDTVRLEGPVIAAAPSPTTGLDLMAIGAAMRTQQIAGALTRLTAMTTQYAQERVQFGRPIGKFQAVQQNLAAMAGQTAAAVAAADLAADAVADGARMLPIAAGKARAGEAAGIAAGIAHQVHGAIGFTFEHSLHFLTRRLWSWRDEFGKDAVWNRRLGHHMAGVGADGVWAAITAG